MYSSRDKEFHEGVEASMGTDEAGKKIKLQFPSESLNRYGGGMYNELTSLDAVSTAYAQFINHSSRHGNVGVNFDKLHRVFKKPRQRISMVLASTTRERFRTLRIGRSRVFSSCTSA